MKRASLAALLLSFLSLSVKAGAPQKLTFIPLWSPQAQFAGYYMAQEKGFYENRGLKVSILTGGPDQPAKDWLRNGKADIAVLWLSEALEMRAAGTRVVNVAQINQRSALVLVAKKSSGVLKPKDLNGRKVGLWDSFQIQPIAFFQREGLRVRPITQSHSIDLFLRGGVDAASAMLYNEYHTILNSGLDPDELTVFRMEGPGLDFPEDGLYVKEELWNRRPQAACAFVSASLDGWRYAFDHEKETLAVVLRRMEEAGVPADPVHQRWMLEKMKELFTDHDGKLLSGRLKTQDYRRVADTLAGEGLLRRPSTYADFARICPGL